MKRLKPALPFLLFGVHAAAFGRGVSPYLPLNLEPEIESQIERVLIIAGQPVIRRPIAAATVLDALPKACKTDAVLCERVRRYLARYTHSEGVARASIEGAVSSGSGTKTVIPNRYGMTEDSHWNASAQVYTQLSDYFLADLGVNAYHGHTDYTGSLLSFGWDLAQLDIGYRPHWFSPMSDSSLLMSTEAPTMPSVTLSNYRPLTRLGLGYELFAARMSKSEHILFQDGFTTGHPRLAGIHLEAQPVEGWSFGVNRLLQYGGGARGGGSLKDLFKAYFNPSGNQSNPADKQVFGNQEASLTSTLVFPGRVPFAVYAEYGGEDTSAGKNYLLGNSALSVGIHFPRLWKRFDLTLEATEWQDTWYIHFIYQDGLTNYGRVVGNWFGDQRVFNDYIGGRSQTMILRYDAPFGGQFMLRYRQLQNQYYDQPFNYHYQRYHDIALGYSRPWQNMLVGAQIESGKDVFGDSFARLEGFLRYQGNASGLAGLSGMSEMSDDEPLIKNGEVFVDVGANASRQSIDLYSVETRYNSKVKSGWHFAVGARRFVSDHSDFGTRIEVDDIQNHNLLGVRLIDYRYRFRFPLALTLGLGAVRYNLETPAYGIYWATGAQWRNLFPGWDLSFDVRYATSVARDHLLPTDPPNLGARNDSFYNILSATIGVSKKF
jgi:hypothetical protein